MQQTENGLSRNVTSFQATNHLKLPRDSARQSVPRTKGPSPLVAQRKRECGLLRIKTFHTLILSYTSKQRDMA